MYCIISTILQYDSFFTHLCIVRFMNTYNMPLWYGTFCTQYNTHTELFVHNTIHIVRY